MKKERRLSRNQTYMLITIPIVALFFVFNTLPLIQGIIHSFTNFKGYGDFADRTMHAYRYAGD